MGTSTSNNFLPSWATNDQYLPSLILMIASTPLKIYFAISFDYKLPMQQRDALYTGTYEGDILSDRTKKINNLTEVLQKQKQKVKQLLQNQKHRDNKHTKHHNQLQNQEPMSHRKGTEVYQRICTEVIDIGNRVLPGRRQNKINQQSIEGKDLGKQEKDELEEEDKEMEYLKSEEYRMYLESITKENGGTANQLIAKMRQTRNHNAYLNPLSQRQASPRPSISPRTNRNDPVPVQRYRELANQRPLPQRQQAHALPSRDETLILDDYNLRRQLQLQALALQSARRRTMVHTPTMKDIHRALPLDKTTAQRTKQMRLESKTIDFSYKESVDNQVEKGRKSRQTHFRIEKHQDQLDSKSSHKILKTWDVYPFFESKPQKDNRAGWRDTSNIKADHAMRNKKTIKTNQSRYGYSAVPAIRKKKQQKQDYRLRTQSKSPSSIMNSSGNASPEKEQYRIDFKLQYPNSQKRIKGKGYICQQTKSKSLIRKQNLIKYHEQVFQPSLTDKKGLDSETTSTVTQSDCPPSYGPSKINKLTVVTPSRTKQRPVKH